MSETIPLAEQPAVARNRFALGGEALRFIMVGGTGALAFVCLSTLLVSLHTGVPDWIISILCWIGLIGPVYLGHHAVSFRSAAPHREALPRYVAVQLMSVCLVTVFSYLCYRALALPPVVAALLVTGLTTGINFVILRVWAFGRRA